MRILGIYGVGKVRSKHLVSNVYKMLRAVNTKEYYGKNGHLELTLHLPDREINLKESKFDEIFETISEKSDEFFFNTTFLEQLKKEMFKE